LPVWLCHQCGGEVCIAGLDDLARRTGLDAGQLDPHRPAVDQWTFACERCGGTMHRVASVVDAAFEAAVLSCSGSSRPDLAIGLGDTQSGWLGDLTTMAALLPGAFAWEKAISLPERGADAAWDLRRIGSADAVRWAACTGVTPDQAESEFLRPLWRLSTSRLDLHTQPSRARGGEEAHDLGSDLLDRWLRARFHQVLEACTQALEAQDPGRSAEELAAFVGDLLGWYEPLRPGGGGEVLEALSRSLAPFVPHLAEAVRRQVCGRSAESVHLAAWPVPDPAWEDRALLAHMAHLRRLAALGQSARSRAAINPDRLLRQAAVGLLQGDPAELAELGPFEKVLARVLGVSKVQFMPDLAAQVRWHLTLNAGQPVERDVTILEIEAALAELDAGAALHLASQLRAGLSIGFQVSGRAITLLPDEVSLSAQARPGWSAAADAGHLVVLKVG
jgi:isoleucyl-tRNA synthetase